MTGRYKETNVAGTSFLRAKSVQVSNEMDQTPFITFIEESVTTLPNRTIREIVSTLFAQYDPTQVIPLINPETGELLGQDVTHEYFYVILYSLYMKLAKERDLRDEANLNSPGSTP